ncbi:MAG: alanine racemase [Candidatus Latescibacterota bacterium]
MTPVAQDRESLVRALLAQLESEADGLEPGELTALVESALRRRALLLEAARRFGTPQYLLEEESLAAQIARFQAAFSRPGQLVRTFYAFKANPSLPVVRTVRRSGLGADASSGLELQLALRCGFERIVLSGPAKTDDELALAARHAQRVTVHLDSPRELERLEAIAERAGQTVQAGIRLNVQAHGAWTKFGVPLHLLPEVVRQAGRLHSVRLCGVQFHLSWNRHARRYVETLAALGPALRVQAPPGGWSFVDIGGGYYPEGDEAVYPWLTPAGRMGALLGLHPAEGPPPDWDLRYLVHRVQPIEAMAAQVLESFREHVTATLGPVELWNEPGRYLVNQAVHLLLRVADVKGDDVAITDGGTNLLGWERLELEHVPLVNLSQPAPTQRRHRVYGSLCTPHDLWGYAYYGSGLDVGDVLLLPAQGAYVQTLAQRFIKPLCQIVMAQAGGRLRRVAAAEGFPRRYPGLRACPRV